MRGRAGEIEKALYALASRVAEELSADGWSRRRLDEHNIADLTRSRHGGLTAVVEIDRTSSQWPDDWPVEVGASLGVGLRSGVLNLIPLLALDP